ncbi:MAG: hypothetical protein QM723_18500 [Myxococcaceae bacterium]
MADHVAEMRARFRQYMLRVLLVLVLVPAAGALLIALCRMYELGALKGAIGIATGVGTLTAALLVHRATVRCPACNKWILPVGVNGMVPSQCPSCKVALS